MALLAKLAAVLVCIIAIAACGTTALSQSQRETMEEYVDLIADAIHISATELKKPLREYHVKHGSWPEDGKGRQQIVAATDEILADHGVEKINLLTIDRDEVLVEYFFSKQRYLHFPALIESWLIVFSGKNPLQMQIVSVYPNWCNPVELAKQTPYSVELIARLQEQFQRQLSDKLKQHGVILNQPINQSV